MAGNSNANSASANDIKDEAAVFQCDSCQSIIGDSSAYVDLLEEIGIIVLKSVDSSTSMKISRATSKDVIPGISGACKKVFCTKCSQRIGAVYIKGLPSSLIHLKDCLCLQVDHITSHKIPLPASPPALDNQSLMATLNYTLKEITKVKYMILSLNERMEAIENSLREGATQDALS